MKSQTVFFLLGALLLSAPARADRRQAEADLAAATTLNRLSQKLQEAGQVIDGWMRGGDQRTTEVRLNAILGYFAVEEQNFATHPLPGKSQELQEGALQCIKKRHQALLEAKALIATQKVNASSLRQYCQVTLEATRLSQRQWFQVRLAFIRQNLLHEKSQPLSEFYKWQAVMLDRWLEEADIASQTESLLLRTYNTDKEQAQLAQESQQLMRQALRLHDKTESFSVPAALKDCQARALAEQEGLIRVCESVFFLYEDPSPDAESNLRHWLATLGGRSLNLEAATTAALQKALQSKP